MAIGLIALYFLQELALDAVRCVTVEQGNGQREIDIKKYAKIEKIPGGSIEDCRVLQGVMFNKDVVAPGRMRRRIENPRILLLDCPLEYKKGESQTNVELMKESDWCVDHVVDHHRLNDYCTCVVNVSR